jgi:hypothetical protein
MTSWLTTHYAHPQPDTIPWHILLQAQHKRAVAGIETGDHVFFYEHRGNRPVKGEPLRPPGRQGIIRIATVSGPIYQRDGLLEYTDGASKDWAWGVPCDAGVDTAGFVPRIQVNEVLQYKPGSLLRALNRGTGVKKLLEEQANELRRQFRSNASQSHPAW